MDRRESQVQSPSICHRLFNFIFKILETQAIKTVTLGSFNNQGLAQVHASNASHQELSSKSEQIVQLVTQGKALWFQKPSLS